ncbi:hypothetical protein HMPREF9004_0034 [Schaalia cardiffensis F0333]|uniref:Uncharacterized protein n=1 Tax=Schaalia cardiffensis F0333 TaxID=888050 RepID=N6W976_9ACTO|nr:hypothetical protein HMPREF9004_0034 [Schaalia cardiffensis F0333]
MLVASSRNRRGTDALATQRGDDRARPGRGFDPPMLIKRFDNATFR